jgi:hypothetical protein
MPHHPHAHRRVPSKNGFAAALANLDAYAADNGDGDFTLPTGAFDGGAGAAALAAELARPQSQPVVGSSEIGGYDQGGPGGQGEGDEWIVVPRAQGQGGEAATQRGALHQDEVRNGERRGSLPQHSQHVQQGTPQMEGRNRTGQAEGLAVSGYAEVVG